jgi:hypothetical protein
MEHNSANCPYDQGNKTHSKNDKYRRNIGRSSDSDSDARVVCIAYDQLDDCPLHVRKVVVVRLKSRDQDTQEIGSDSPEWQFHPHQS